MSAEHVLTMLNEHEVKFVDLRFTDTKGKEQHVTIPAHQVNAEFFEEGKMFDGSSIGGWKGITNPTWFWCQMRPLRSLIRSSKNLP